MKVMKGKLDLMATYQNPFPEWVNCAYCKGETRFAFTAIEDSKEEEYVCDMHQNDPKGKGYWLHDACAVAVYFCKKCLKPTAEYNQA